MIICDTREQKNEHILKYFEKHGIKYEKAAVDTADYYSTDNPSIRVERKKDLGELAHNLLSRDKGRFYREIRRAREKGLKIYVVCENGKGVKNIEDVAKWENQYGKVTGRELREAIYKCAIAYGIEFLFCNRRQTGKLIYEILNGKVRAVK